MKKYIQLATIICMSAIVFVTGASAQRRFGGGKQDSATIAQRKAYRQQLQAKYDSLSPEKKKEIHQKMRNRGGKQDSTAIAQRKANRLQWKAKYDSLSPEEKKAIHQKMRSRMREKMDSASPEQKRQWREKFRNMSPEERRKLRNDVMKGADSIGAEKPRGRRVKTNN